MSWIAWIYRQVFYCKRRLCPNVKRNVDIIPQSKLPWFWVGTHFLDNTISVTDIVNNHVKYGVPITSQFLNEITEFQEANIIWKYVDVKTLEEKEFPPEGIVIENDNFYQPVSRT